MNDLTVVVARQDGPDRPETRRRERFVVPRHDGMTVADVLEAIARDPRTADGKRVPPVVWAASCSFPVCGACTMLVNGCARPACGTLVDDVAPPKKTLVLEPLPVLPLRRDLWVDTTRMRRDTARVLAAVDAAGPSPPPPTVAAFARCTSCGACLDACPEVSRDGAFVGPAAIDAARAAELLAPSPARAAALLAPGGIGDCGSAQACLEACPEDIPLDEALAAAHRLATRSFFATLLDRARGQDSAAANKKE